MELRFPLILDGATGTELQKRGYVYGAHFLPHDADHKKLSDYNRSVKDQLQLLLPGRQRDRGQKGQQGQYHDHLDQRQSAGGCGRPGLRAQHRGTPGSGKAGVHSRVRPRMLTTWRSTGPPRLPVSSIVPVGVMVP